jgi:hypothetical protein
VHDRSDTGTHTESEPDMRRRLTPGVASVRAASLCSDTSHELATSLLPSFVTSTLHAGPAALGVSKAFRTP